MSWIIETSYWLDYAYHGFYCDESFHCSLIKVLNNVVIWEEEVNSFTQDGCQIYSLICCAPTWTLRTKYLPSTDWDQLFVLIIFFFFLALINIVNEGCDHAIYPFMHTVHSSCPLKSLRLWFWCNFLSLKFPFRPLSFVLSFSRCRNFKIRLFPVSTKCYKCVQ